MKRDHIDMDAGAEPGLMALRCLNCQRALRLALPMYADELSDVISWFISKHAACAAPAVTAARYGIPPFLPGELARVRLNELIRKHADTDLNQHREGPP